MIPIQFNYYVIFLMLINNVTKNFIFLFLLFFMFGCVTHPPLAHNKLPFKYGNDCLPQAIIMTQSLKEKGIEANVLGIYTDKWGHAICVYMYPSGQNKMWGWDRFWKSMRLRAWKNDPESIAKEWMRVTLSEDKLQYAMFHDK